MITFLNKIDHSLFLFLNGLHSDFLDPVMFYGSKGFVWFPLYAVFLYLVIRNYKRQALLVILFAAVMITVSDQLCDFAKDFFQRIRPSHEPGLMVHIVKEYTGGQFGFYSGHASNTFALATFLIVLLGRYYRYFYIPAVLWALFMSYTRIYLGVHFPGDSLVGMIIGSCLGFLCGEIFLKISEKKKINRQVARTQRK